MSPQKKPPLSEVLLELKKDYLQFFPQKLARLEELTEKQDWENLETEYHKLKGSGETYGFPEISIVCEVLEFLAPRKNSAAPNTTKQVTFAQAIELLKRMHETYLQKKSFSLERDVFASHLLALKPK